MQKKILWQPNETTIKSSRIQEYKDYVEKAYAKKFSDYHHLWRWSVENIDQFWESIFRHYHIIDHGSYVKPLGRHAMPGAKWFEGTKLNYSEHIFRNKHLSSPAIIHAHEGSSYQSISWSELEDKVARFRTFLVEQGIQKGDRVVAFMPNIPETNIAFLAVNSLGAVWSSCSPDFGSESVLDRFSQIEPKILIACNGYTYNGKPYNKTETVRKIKSQLPSVEKLVWVSFLSDHPIQTNEDEFLWENCLEEKQPLIFEPVEFDHPIWILYSSGTTGRPKAITHSHGGCLLEHLKYMALHNDVKPGEKFFWYTTTGWMMWNFLQSSLLAGATMVLYEGSAKYPDLHFLWQFASDLKIEHFGTSPPFVLACMKEEINPKSRFDFSHLRSISTTGAPMPSDAFEWCYDHVKSDLWLCSMSGGTDVCTAFVGGCIMEPVISGRIQVRALGCALYAYDEHGHHIENALGEMVIEKAMPSMPIYFWGDTDNQRYLSAYFETYPGKWRHGDWIEIFSDGGLQITGRSDATLNRHGIRIGTAEIYQALHTINAVEDALIVNIEKENGENYMPLFVKLKSGEKLTSELKNEINETLRKTYSPRHIPDEIIEVPDIPYTISGKKLEAPIKKILMGMPPGRAANPDAMRNPESLEFFENFNA